MRDTKVFLKLLQLDLAAHPPGAPVIKMWITAQPAPPRSAQRGLFLPITPEPEKLEITLARISAIVGERRAGIARLLDSHRRESFQIDRFSAAGDGANSSSNPTMRYEVGSPAAIAMRLIRPACRLKVDLSKGAPPILAIRNKQKEAKTCKERFCGRQGRGVRRAIGGRRTPNEKSQAELSGPWDREEWDIALATANGKCPWINRTRCALSHLPRSGHRQWFADASYD